MNLDSMTFTDSGGQFYPDTVTVTLTIREAAYIATIAGKQSGVTAEAFMPGGSHTNHSIYEVLTGDVFNRYWDDGVSEARERLEAAG